MDLNRTQLLGRLTKDPELKSTPAGKSVATVSIATSSSYKDKNDAWQEKSQFTDCVLWGKHAENISKFAKKGSRIYLEGKLETRMWEDKEGKKRYKTEVVGSMFILLDKKEHSFSNLDSKAVPVPGQMVDDSAGDISVDEVPF